VMAKGGVPNTSYGCMGTLGWLIFLAFFIAALMYQNSKRDLPEPPPVYINSPAPAVTK
jgi:hypothetical protein